MDDRGANTEISPPNPKRMHRKKAPFACEACQKRKSRCEVFSATSDVCHRCDLLGTECTLAALRGSIQSAIPTRTVDGTDGSDAGRSSGLNADALKVLVEHIDQRTSEIVRLLHNKSHSTSSTPPFFSPGAVSAREDGVGDGDDIEPEVWELLHHSNGVALQVMTGLNIHDRTSFHDPVLNGVLSELEFDNVCLQFSTHIRQTSPVDALLADPPLLRHPFLRCAIVHFMSFARSSSLEDTVAHRKVEAMMLANLNLLDDANPSPATLIGLLILCLSPASGFERRFQRSYAPPGIIARASSIAHGLGLEDAVERARQESEKDLVEATCFQPLIVKLALFYTLLHQSAWSDIYLSPSLSNRHTASSPLTSILSLGSIRKLQSPLLIHLYYESTLLAQIAHMSTALQRVRTASIFDRPRHMVLKHRMEEYDTFIKQWRIDVEQEQSLESKHFLVLNSIFLECLMCLKISTDAGTLLPSPIVIEDRMPFRMAFGERMIGCMRQLVSFITSSPLKLSHAPSFFLTLSFLPFRGLLNATLIDPGMLPIVQSLEFGQFRDILVNTHPMSPAMVDKICQSQPPGGWKMVVEEREAATRTPSMAELVDTWEMPTALSEILQQANYEDLQQWWAFENVTSSLGMFESQGALNGD